MTIYNKNCLHIAFLDQNNLQIIPNTHIVVLLTFFLTAKGLPC